HLVQSRDLAGRRRRHNGVHDRLGGPRALRQPRVGRGAAQRSRRRNRADGRRRGRRCRQPARERGAVACETMRLRPVVPTTALETNADVALGDVLVPKGTLVFVLPRPAAVSAENFADPLAFRPDRWLNPSGGPHNVSAFLPFGSGPRMCPGRSLALLEIKNLLSMLYKNFTVQRVGRSS